MIEQAHPQRRLGVDKVAGKAHLLGEGRADTGRKVEEYGAGIDAHPPVGVGEGGALGPDDEVAGQGQLETAGHRRAV